MIEQKLIIKGTKILPSNVGIIKCHSALKVQLIILHYYSQPPTKLNKRKKILP